MTPFRGIPRTAALLLAASLAGSCDLVDALAGSCHVEEATNLLEDYKRGCLATVMFEGTMVTLMSSEFDTTAPDLRFGLQPPFFVGKRGSSFLTFDSFESHGESGFVDWVVTGVDETRFGERISIEVVRGQFRFANTTSELRLNFRGEIL